MSTTIEPSVATPSLAAARHSLRSGRPNARDYDSRVLLHGIDWALFQQLMAAQGDRLSPRVSYDTGELELMSPSYWHEALARRFGQFVTLLARGLRRTYRDGGSTRWGREEIDKAKEPDACFYLANEPRIRALTEIDLSTDPPPDLAIEIVLTNPLLDALRIYAALAVPEVWVYNGRTVRFLHRRDDGTYADSESSRNFPGLRTWEVQGWIARADALGDLDWSFEVEAWARDELAGRRPAGA